MSTTERVQGYCLTLGLGSQASRSLLLSLVEADHIDPWCLLMGAATSQHSAFSVKTGSHVMSVFEVEVCFLHAAEGWILFSYPFC